jgi:hypothetical protein
MTNKELLLISHLLKMASDTFCEHICNDFNLSNFFTEDERIAFNQEYHEWNGDPESHNPEAAKSGYVMDWILMSYFSHKIVQQI